MTPFFLQQDTTISDWMFGIIALIYFLIQFFSGRKSEKKKPLPPIKEEEEDDVFADEREVIEKKAEQIFMPQQPVEEPTKKQSTELSFEFRTNIENRKQKTSIEDRSLEHLHVAVEERTGDKLVSSHIKKLVKGDPSKIQKGPEPLEKLFTKFGPKKSFILSYEILNRRF